MYYLLLFLSLSLFFNLKATEIQQFKEQMISQIADNYETPSLSIGDPEKYAWPKVIARLEKYGENDSIANWYLDSLKNNSPFHFTLIGMARIMALYPNNKIVAENRQRIIKNVFDREDSYNAWTAEGTENHINMSRTSGYLFAQYALEYEDMKVEAEQRLAQMKEWIKWWSKTIFNYGTGEWNSSIYETFNLIGWLNLYDFAEDKEVKAIARAVLDFYSLEMALHWNFGVSGGAEMRGSGVYLEGESSTDYYCRYWFSYDSIYKPKMKGSAYIQLVHAITSKYSPPKEIVDLAFDKHLKQNYYIGSNPSYCFEEPSFVKKTLMVTSEYTIGSSVDNYGGFFGSSFQYVPWKLVIKNKTNFPFVISGNGTYNKNYSGKSRNPYTQVVQHKNVLLLLNNVPSDAYTYHLQMKDSLNRWNERAMKDLKTRFPSETYKNNHPLVNMPANVDFTNASFITLPHIQLNDAGTYYTACFNDVCVVITSLNKENDTIFYEKNRTILQTKNHPNKLCGFVVEVAKIDSLSNVINRRQIKVTEKSVKYLADEWIEVKYQREGTYIEPLVDWGYGPQEPMTIPMPPHFKQPQWKETHHAGRIPKVFINSKPLKYNSLWPVYKGPGVLVESGVLNVGAYTVDYRGEVPVFKEK